MFHGGQWYWNKLEILGQAQISETHTWKYWKLNICMFKQKLKKNFHSGSFQSSEIQTLTKLFTQKPDENPSFCCTLRYQELWSSKFSTMVNHGEAFCSYDERPSFHQNFHQLLWRFSLKLLMLILHSKTFQTSWKSVTPENSRALKV